jgi:hypothetical protein
VVQSVWNVGVALIDPSTAGHRRAEGIIGGLDRHVEVAQPDVSWRVTYGDEFDSFDAAREQLRKDLAGVDVGWNEVLTVD